MGTAATPVSVTEYRSTIYEPDMDYVDGVLEDRNVGELDHSKLQKRLLLLLTKAGFECAYPELRLQVSATRYRIPDVCVFLDEPAEQAPSEPPVLVIEILSLEDRFSRVQARLDDFTAMGCPCAWVLDPQARKAFRFDGAVQVPVTGEMAHPAIPALRLRVAGVFGL